MAKRADRIKQLLDLLAIEKRLTADEVSVRLGISDSSTRRLFVDMAQSGQAIRVLGGIQAVEPADVDYSFDDLEKSHLSEKREIAGLAVRLIENRDVIYLDSGTTVFQLAIAIKQRFSLQSANRAGQGNEPLSQQPANHLGQGSEPLSQLKVITNSFANMQMLQDVCEVVLIGGIYRPRRKDFAGYATEQFLKTFYYQKAFLGGDGFDFAQGFMGTDLETSRLNEVVIAQSEQSFALLDASKIGRRSFTRYAEASDIDILITDRGISSDAEDKCRHAGLNILKPE